MTSSAKAVLLYFYHATQPFVWISPGTGLGQSAWLLEHGYLEEVSTRRGPRLKVSEKGKSYAYREMRGR